MNPSETHAPEIHFMVVRSWRSVRKPSDVIVMAIADGQLVKFTPNQGYTCGCDEDGESCVHVDSVDAMVADQVFVEPEDGQLKPSRRPRVVSPRP